MIPIENIYYLLSYAWNKLDDKDRVQVSIDGNTKLLDLFAKVLINSSKLLLKRGIAHNYINITQELSGLKGKLEISQTLKSNLLLKQRTLCTFDEFSANILINQILISTLYHLIRIKELDTELKNEIKSLIWRFSGIDLLELNSSSFKNIKIDRNNHFYNFILNVCHIIYENSLPSEELGAYLFSDFTRDENKMNQLFEAFVRNFYRIHLKNKFTVGSKEIEWKFESKDIESRDYLPQMKTDITLENDNYKLIIDTKYYQDTMKINFNKEKIVPNNLYQLFSYLLNQEDQNEKSINATGMLLYPTIEKDYNLEYKYNQHAILIRTVNLNANWRDIEDRLLKIIKVVMPHNLVV